MKFKYKRAAPDDPATAPTDHVSHVVERRHTKGQLPEYRSTVTVVHRGELAEHQSEWRPADRFMTVLAVQRGLERDALLRWLASSGGG